MNLIGWCLVVVVLLLGGAFPKCARASEVLTKTPKSDISAGTATRPSPVSADENTNIFSGVGRFFDEIFNGEDPSQGQFQVKLYSYLFRPTIFNFCSSVD